MSSVSGSWPKATSDREYKRVTEEIGACFFITGKKSTSRRWFRIDAENKNKCLACIKSQAAGKSQGICWHLESEQRCKRCVNRGRCDQPSQLLIHMVSRTGEHVNRFGSTHAVERWEKVAAQARHEEKCLKELKPLEFVDSTRDFWCSDAFQITPEENALIQAAFPGLEVHTATEETPESSSEAEIPLKTKIVRIADSSPFAIKRKCVTPFSGTPRKKARVETKPHSILKPSAQPVQPTENEVPDDEGPSEGLDSTSGDETRASEAATDLDGFLKNEPSDPAVAEAEKEGRKGFSQLKAAFTGLQHSKKLAMGPLLEAGVRAIPSTEGKKIGLLEPPAAQSDDESTSPESSPFAPGTLGAWFMEGARLFGSLEDRVDGFDDRLTVLEQNVRRLERSRSRYQ